MMPNLTMPTFPALSWLQAHVPMAEFTRIQHAFTEEWMAVMQAAERPPIKDRRFSDPAWYDNPGSYYTAQAYLLSSRTLMRMVEALDVEPAVRERVRFAVMQWVDAMSPANFLALNPDAQRRLVESHGETLRQGMANLLEDISKGRISQTDESQFEVGRNVAVTPGHVIFENRMMQLIQYAPRTDTVHARPLVIVPPCINKYYILDLQPRNSLVAWLVEQGHTVFLISWRNPMPTDTDGILQATWDDYIREGVLTSLAVAGAVSGQPQVNAMGFCVGGTMLSTALAVARTQGLNPVASLSLLTSFLDFSETGVIDVFIDEAHVALREQQLGLGGLLPAWELATTFSFLRPNELVWNYVVGNYLKGEKPRAFDLLFWNADSTNLPGPFFVWYLRNTYLENNLIKPGHLQVAGTPLHLQELELPTYIYASRDDHIVPWKSAYASTQVLPGPKRFVLGASGHIAGVINPPAAGRRSHWVHEPSGEFPEAEQWLAEAEEQPGSWWPDWGNWLASHGGGQVTAPTQAGNADYPPTEAAPGRYVRVRAV